MGNRQCDGCQNWLKLKNDQHGGGICQFQDGRSSSDDSCKFFRHKPKDKGIILWSTCIHKEFKE